MTAETTRDDGRFTARERASREPEALAKTFHVFARLEAPQLDSPLYAELCYGIAGDPQLLAIAAETPSSQPPPNMLLAAVQSLLLGGAEHPLRDHYPAISGAPRPLAPAFPLFREFVLEQREAIVDLLRTRRTQTNVIRRCTLLLPALGAITEEANRPLALIDIGASAGLNLNLDRYRYAYTAPDGTTLAEWGDPASAVALTAEVRGRVPLALPLPADLAIAWRRGVDLAPIGLDDEDALLWLRSLIWPEHVERHARLLAALELARADPPLVRSGDAVALLPELIAGAPAEAELVLYATHALYQFSREDVASILRLLREASRARRVWLIALEGSAADHSELVRVRLEGGKADARLLAQASPHGWWLRWLAEGEAAPEQSRWLSWVVRELESDGG